MGEGGAHLCAALRALLEHDHLVPECCQRPDCTDHSGLWIALDSFQSNQEDVWIVCDSSVNEPPQIVFHTAHKQTEGLDGWLRASERPYRLSAMLVRYQMDKQE